MPRQCSGTLTQLASALRARLVQEPVPARTTLKKNQPKRKQLDGEAGWHVMLSWPSFPAHGLGIDQLSSFHHSQYSHQSPKHFHLYWKSISSSSSPVQTQQLALRLRHVIAFTASSPPSPPSPHQNAPIAATEKHNCPHWSAHTLASLYCSISIFFSWAGRQSSESASFLLISSTPCTHWLEHLHKSRLLIDIVCSASIAHRMSPARRSVGSRSVDWGAMAKPFCSTT